ncbi:MAG: 2-dehydro-3-deoxy-L-rhamnonate dehydrogenase [Chloroflexota bacterium]|jgi:3-oxoacyl-[acyl-carrier protein] reductase|nr:2-dehydro-3-deoxy-L-rhamnonate dehydrogenase [Chloroflexota bacterium]
MESSIAGRVAIVTTNTEDEGISAAEGLLRAGVRVSVWDPDADELAQVRKEFEAAGLKADYRHVEITRLDAVQAAHDAVAREFGDVDILVNHATLRGTYMAGPDNPSREPVPFWELNIDRFHRAVEVNIVGMYTCSRVVAAGMVARGHGSIMTQTTSGNTKRNPFNQPYGASKAFVEAFTAAAADGLKQYGVRCNAFQSSGQTNRRGEYDQKKLPFDCMLPMILYLASDASRDVTGQVLDRETFKAPG